jgi:biopolymer transport protein ExbD
MFLNFSFGYRVYYSIKVRVLPEVFSTSETKEGNPQFLIMVVDKDKNISINSEIFNFNDISTQVRRELEMRPTNRRKVLLKASKQLKYGDVAKIIDEIKGAGASDIVLQVDDLNSL